MATDPPDEDDHYELLGVAVEVDAGQLRRAWRQLALRWHPDRAGPGATARFQKLLAAYTVLSDPALRAEYDRRRGIARHSGRRRAPGVMLQRLSGPLNSLLACGVARRAEEDVIELSITEKDASTGGMVRISMRVLVHCPACAAGAAGPCPRCEGSRVVHELFSAWLAVPPDVTDGAVLKPSVLLRGMIRPVFFRVRRRGAA